MGIQRNAPGHQRTEGAPSVAPVVSVVRPRQVARVPRILVIDDDLLVRSMMERALERYGFRVVSASGGRAAIELFRSEAATIDLVLLDLTMPGLSGEETFLELLEIDPGVRVVFSSGAAIGADGQGLPEGFAGYVQKPCLPSQLVAVLRGVLERDAAR